MLELDRGTRVHVIDAPVGQLSVNYEATVALGEADAVDVTESERFHYRLPSRYCPSDRVEGFAATEFGPVTDEAHGSPARRVVGERAPLLPAGVDHRR